MICEQPLLRGDRILDAILIASEIVGECKSKEKDGFLLKLDLEKTYDKVDWSFLDAVLELKGFGLRWRRWIGGCLANTNFLL